MENLGATLFGRINVKYVPRRSVASIDEFRWYCGCFLFLYQFTMNDAIKIEFNQRLSMTTNSTLNEQKLGRSNAIETVFMRDKKLLSVTWH